MAEIAPEAGPTSGQNTSASTDDTCSAKRHPGPTLAGLADGIAAAAKFEKVVYDISYIVGNLTVSVCPVCASVVSTDDYGDGKIDCSTKDCDVLVCRQCDAEKHCLSCVLRKIAEYRLCPECPDDVAVALGLVDFAMLAHIATAHVDADADTECIPCPHCLRLVFEPGPYPEFGFCAHCGEPVCPSCVDRASKIDADTCPRCGAGLCTRPDGGCASLGLSECSGGVHKRCKDCVFDEGATSPSGICPDCDPVLGKPAAEATDIRAGNRGRTSV